jgi:hypothetical protein
VTTSLLLKREGDKTLMKMIILNSLDKRAVLVGGAHKEEGQLDHQNYLELYYA